MNINICDDGNVEQEVVGKVHPPCYLPSQKAEKVLKEMRTCSLLIDQGVMHLPAHNQCNVFSRMPPVAPRIYVWICLPVFTAGNLENKFKTSD